MQHLPFALRFLLFPLYFPALAPMDYPLLPRSVPHPVAALPPEQSRFAADPPRRSPAVPAPTPAADPVRKFPPPAFPAVQADWSVRIAVRCGKNNLPSAPALPAAAIIFEYNLFFSFSYSRCTSSLILSCLEYPLIRHLSSVLSVKAIGTKGDTQKAPPGLSQNGFSGGALFLIIRFPSRPERL